MSVAAVGEAISPGGLEDCEARARAVTRYFATSHKPMLPRYLEGRLTLDAYRERDALTVDLQIDSTGLIRSCEVYPSRLKAAPRLHHGQVVDILTTRTHVLHDTMKTAEQLALTLLSRRRQGGALALYDLNHGWVTDEDGQVRKVEKSRSNVAYLIVQELMIAANQSLATFARDREIPVLYRTHTVRGAIDRDGLMRDIDTAASTEDLVNMSMRVDHLLNRAQYNATPGPHWGLAIDLYMHSTSPLRRYADLVSQRQVFAHLRRRSFPHSLAELAETAAHINSKVLGYEMQMSRDAAERATREGARAIAAGAPVLANLDDTKLERVLKTATRSGEPCPADLAKEISVRLAADRMTMLGRVVVLFDSPRETDGWEEVRKAVVAHLAKTPTDAASMLTIMLSLKRLPPVVRHWKDAACGFVASSILTLDSGTWTGHGSGIRKKEAMAEADVELIAHLLGLTPPGPQPTMAGSGAPSMKVEKSPISILHEYQQGRKMPPPIFTFEERRDGFWCVCSMSNPDGSVVKGNAGPQGAKSEAKHGAAADVVSKLVAMGTVAT